MQQQHGCFGRVGTEALEHARANVTVPCPDVAQELRMDAFRTAGRNLRPGAAEVGDPAPENAPQAGKPRKIRPDDELGTRQAQMKRGRRGAVHDPAIARGKFLGQSPLFGPVAQDPAGPPQHVAVDRDIGKIKERGSLLRVRGLAAAGTADHDHAVCPAGDFRRFPDADHAKCLREAAAFRRESHSRQAALP